MKKILVCLFLLVTQFAQAQVQLNDLVIARKGDDVNIRVNINNPGPHGDRGPIIAELWVRGQNEEEWRLLKTWTNIGKLARGHKVSRDFFSGSPGHDDYAFHGNFEVRGVVRSESSGAESELYKSFP